MYLNAFKCDMSENLNELLSDNGLIHWHQLGHNMLIQPLICIFFPYTIIYAGLAPLGFLKESLGAAKSALQNRLEQKPATFSGLRYGNDLCEVQHVQLFS